MGRRSGWNARLPLKEKITGSTPVRPTTLSQHLFVGTGTGAMYLFPITAVLRLKVLTLGVKSTRASSCSAEAKLAVFARLVGHLPSMQA